MLKIAAMKLSQSVGNPPKVVVALGMLLAIGTSPARANAGPEAAESELSSATWYYQCTRIEHFDYFDRHSPTYGKLYKVEYEWLYVGDDLGVNVTGTCTGWHYFSDYCSFAIDTGRNEMTCNEKTQAQFIRTP
jgi:hypothetical protein